MTKVLVFGVFDLLHKGHEYFLNNAKAYGDYLIVSVARDSYVQSFKGRLPVHSQDERVKALLNSGLADKAVLSDEDIGSFNIISREVPNVICLGYDQGKLKTTLENWLTLHDLSVTIHIIQPYKEDTYKTSHLINKRN